MSNGVRGDVRQADHQKALIDMTSKLASPGRLPRQQQKYFIFEIINLEYEDVSGGDGTEHLALSEITTAIHRICGLISTFGPVPSKKFYLQAIVSGVIRTAVPAERETTK